MPSTEPPTTQINYVRFTYPFTSPTLSFTCKTPELGNTETISLLRVIRQTRGNTLRVVRSAQWPKVEVLNLNFTDLTETDAINFKALLGQSVGKYIGYLDYLSRQWKCLITNPDTPISEEKVNRGFSIQLQMEGTIQ